MHLCMSILAEQMTLTYLLPQTVAIALKQPEASWLEPV